MREDGLIIARNASIDNARAIAITLVIIGHIYGINDAIREFIFSFHMPLFFVLSGIFFRPKTEFIDSIKSSLRPILGPYIIFFCIGFVYWLMTRRLSGFDPSVSNWMPLLGFFSGRYIDLFVDPALWFLPCLFVAGLIYNFCILEISQYWLRLLSVFMVLIASLIVCHFSASFQLPWSLGSAGIASAFMYCGGQVKRWMPKSSRITELRIKLLVVMLVSGALTLGLSQINPGVDMSLGYFGANAFIFVAAATLGSVFVLAIGILLPASGLATWLAMNTIFIFPSHLLVFNFLRGFGKVVLGMSVDASRTFAFGLIGVPVSLAVAYVLSLVLPKLFGWAFPKLYSGRL